MRPHPDPSVLTWLARQRLETLYLTTLTLAELLAGVEAMPVGQRRQRFATALDALATVYEGRLLSFDPDAARHYARLFATARGAGRGFPLPDGYIAAIAASRGFVVATRDTAPFAAVGLEVLDPWES